MTRKYFDPAGTVDEKGGPMIKYHTSSFDGSSQPYALYVPNAYSPDARWPLVISLHGFSSDHVLNLRRVFGLGNACGEPDADCKQVFPAFPEIPCIVASPYGFGSMGYAAQGETDVLDVLADMKRNYSIDDDRVYLTGLSMGGEGTWHIAVRYPDLWAAIAPVCAPTSFFAGPEDVCCLARNLMHLPTHISHGECDTTVPVDESREMARILDELGYSYMYEEYPDVAHNAWDHTYADARIFKWLLQYKRAAKPRKISYTTDRLRYNTAYWIEISHINTWTELARIDAKILKNDSIQIVTKNIGAFILHLDKSPINLELPVKIICNGIEHFSGHLSEPSIQITLNEAPICRLSKRKGLEGPIFDAFKSRFAVAYGTQTDDPEMRDALRCAGDCAAFWSDWADAEIPIFADHEINEEIINTFNLILVGDNRTNLVISRINDKLPIRFSESEIVSDVDVLGDGNSGLIEVYPNPLNPDKYAVIIGGSTEDILMKAASTYRDMPDYGVFSESTDFGKPETFAAFGYFNSCWEME